MSAGPPDDAAREPVVGDPERPRFLPFAYFALAHLCLAVACTAIAAQPATFLGPWYQGRTLAVVHLVTLGWITSSILGACYAIAPMTLRIAMPVRNADGWMALAYALGVTGMTSHFWTGERWGMASSALLVTAALAFVAAKLWRRLRASPLAKQTLLPIRLALINLALTALFGITLTANKLVHFLPGSVLSNVAAHAHLAALGWVAMLILGFGQRLIPMLLPTAMPRPRTIAGIAVLLQAGVLGLVVVLPFSSRLASAGGELAASLTAAALALGCGGIVFLKLRQSKPRAAGLPRPDWGVLHVGAALLWLVGALALGLYLAWTRPDDERLRFVPAYATIGLLGFLGQMIVGVGARMLPIFVWLRAFGGAHWPSPPPPPHALTLAVVQPWCWLAWVCGVAALAGGFLRADPSWLRLGACGVLLATLLNAAALARLGRSLPAISTGPA